MRKLTRFTFYKQTPFTDFQNTISFKNNAERDKYFDTHFTQIFTSLKFNFFWGRNIVNIGKNISDVAFFNEVNYCKFYNEFDHNTYYAQVVESVYLNDGTTELHLVIDGLMTFCQGDISKYAKNVMVERQHLPELTFRSNLKYLRTNDDVLNVNTLAYVHQELLNFSNLKVLMQVSADLEEDFGDENNPHYKSSSGVNYDKITSPVNLYLCDYATYPENMKKIRDYPWITQNFSKVILVPAMFIDESDLIDVKNNKVKFETMKKFKNGATSKNIGEMDILSHSMDEIGTILKTPTQHPEIMRKPYTNIQLTNWQGQNVDVDPSFLPPNIGLEIQGENNVGYDNNIAFYVRGYKSEGENHLTGLKAGTYLDNAIIFKDGEFNKLPILTDNYKLSLAEGANQRALAQNNLITGQAKNVVDPNTNLQDRMMSALNLTSSLSVGAVSGKLVDEWQFYRKQQAEFADKKIAQPSISEATQNNSFAIKQGFFGLTVKYSAIDTISMQAIARYHDLFGYQWQRVDNLQSTQSMKYLNYVKFNGNWIINDRKVPQTIMEQIRIQFENGVKMWHNPDNLANPFTQDITNKNTREV